MFEYIDLEFNPWIQNRIPKSTRKSGELSLREKLHTSKGCASQVIIMAFVLAKKEVETSKN